MKHNEMTIVTGASSGVGKTLCGRLARRGHRVCALARSIGKLEELAKTLPDRIFPYPLDVAHEGAVKEVFEKIHQEHGLADTLINNASVFNSCAFEDEDSTNISRLIDINLKGTMYCTLAVLKQMAARGSGRVINIASVSGTRGIPHQAIYGASKHGVVGFSDVIGQEVKDRGVLVTAICPGGIATPLWNQGNPYPGDESKLISTEEIGDLVEFILDHPTLYKKVIFFPDSEWH